MDEKVTITITVSLSVYERCFESQYAYILPFLLQCGMLEKQPIETHLDTYGAFIHFTQTRTL